MAPDRVDRLIAAERAANLAGEAAMHWRSELIASADAAITEATLDQFLEEALARVRDLLEADSVSFLAANDAGDELLARSSVGLPESISMGVHIAAGAGMAGRVVSSRQPLVVDDLDEILLASPLLKDAGIRSVVAVPVLIGDDVVGVLHAGSFRTHRFAPVDAAALTIVADRLASAMRRVRLLESERATRERSEVLAYRLRHLQQVTAALADDLTGEEVAEVVCSDAGSFVGGGILGCSLWRLAGTELVLVRPAEQASGQDLTTVSREVELLARQALGSSQALWFESWQDLAKQFPEVPTGASLTDRIAVLPLNVRGETTGILVLSCGGAGTFASDEQAFLLAVAEQAALAFDRALLREREREAAVDKTFIVEVAAVLSASLDYELTVRNVTQLLAPGVADVATIHIFDEAERPVLAAIHPPSVDNGAAELPVRLELPLTDAGHIYGRLAVARLDADRPFDEGTAQVLAEVAQRAGVAIANARLHSDLQNSQRAERFVLDVATAIAGASDYQTTLERLASAAVPTLGDICLIDLVDERGTVRRKVAHHADPAKATAMLRLRDDYAPDVNGSHPSIQVMTSAKTLWSGELPEEYLQATTRDSEHLALVKELQFTSFIAVPLALDGRVLGSVTLVSAGSGRRFGPADARLAERLGSQVAAVVDKARRYDSEHRISHVLQHSLLPESLPHLPEVQLAARYLPGTRDAEVGGDFYDAMVLRNGTLTLVVGDVAGHDHFAAAAMGRLRGAIRTLSAQASGPEEVVRTLRRHWECLGFEQMATAILCHLDPSTGQATMMNAGHPPPLLVGVGEAEYLPVPTMTPLGAPESEEVSWSGPVAGKTILFYTDGVIDDRSVGLRHRMHALARLAAQGPRDAQALCDVVLEAMGTRRSDDVAILAVSVGESDV